MMRLLLLMLMLFSFSFGIDKATAIEAVKNNPALLDTPQGELLLKQNGLTKNEVLEIIKKKLLVKIVRSFK